MASCWFQKPSPHSTHTSLDYFGENRWPQWVSFLFGKRLSLNLSLDLSVYPTLGHTLFAHWLTTVFSSRHWLQDKVVFTSCHVRKICEVVMEDWESIVQGGAHEVRCRDDVVDWAMSTVVIPFQYARPSVKWFCWSSIQRWSLHTHKAGLALWLLWPVESSGSDIVQTAELGLHPALQILPLHIWSPALWLLCHEKAQMQDQVVGRPAVWLLHWV